MCSIQHVGLQPILWDIGKSLYVRKQYKLPLRRMACREFGMDFDRDDQYKSVYQSNLDHVDIPQFELKRGPKEILIKEPKL